MKYKIYKLIYNGDVVYVGRTKSTLAKRKGWGYKNSPISLIAKKCSIELIEETDDILRETYWIDYYGIENLMNVRKGEIGLSKKEYNLIYREENKEKLIEFRKEKYSLNREKYITEYYSKKKPLEKRICKCGVEYEATRNNKIHCSRKCKDKYRKPQYIKKAVKPA